jgi:hypothetical protein
MLLLVNQQRPTVLKHIRSLNILFLSSTPSFTKLRRCLLLLPHLSRLFLEFSHSAPPTLLRGLVFPHLRHFQTGSINHGSLSDFLHNNPRINFISIGKCGKARACPIRCNPYLPTASISSGASCLLSIPTRHTYKPIMNLQSRIHAPRDALVSPRQVLSNRRRSLKRLHDLRLDLNFSMATDHGFMQDIIQLAPSVRNLELRECRLPTSVCLPIHETQSLNLTFHTQLGRGPHHRRAWNHRLSWARSLAALPELETLSLKTSAPLIRNPGNHQEERSLIREWTSLFSPSRIHTVVLWYHADTSYSPHNGFLHGPVETGVYSRWSKHAESSRWQRTEFMMGTL